MGHDYNYGEKLYMMIHHFKILFNKVEYIFDISPHEHTLPCHKHVQKQQCQSVRG